MLPTDPHITQSRAFYVRNALDELSEYISSALQREQVKRDQEQEALLQAQQRVEKDEKFLSLSLKDILGQFALKLQKNAFQAEQRCLSVITPSSFSTKTDYSQKVASELRKAVTQALDEIMPDLVRVVREQCRKTLSTVNQQWIRSLLIPSALSVTTANNPLTGAQVGVAAGSVSAGVVIGSIIFPGVGTVVGGLLGGMLSLGASAHSAGKKDIADTKTNITRTIQQIVQKVKDQTPKVVDFLIAQYLEQPPKSLPEPTRLLALQSLLKEAQEIRRMLQTMENKA